ncbi:hypothetical protein DB35_09345 [Streptomyces abyssalis]|uniref:HTH cro/C1-type domain-containing protein n=1 Tax=Streptomyces abyssalis TaxID=933944 RepID=A0A1E7JRT6_9ACTN|nr:helix-turn-helix domain-containing protein [Streptomyces abyssalis]OEU91612.1 hypothetical protein AN215_03470 [Streptomyces abyssalis]OEU94252.1 hypothetical protein DB35_09345 [Streptomyces abyssalis]
MSSGREAPVPSRLGEELEDLKRRSGRSYAALAHRTGLSRSTLHRYCQGATVPGSFGVVERIARVCGASDEEVDRLYRAWRSPDGRQSPVGQESAGQDDSGQVHGGPDDTGPEPPPHDGAEAAAGGQYGGHGQRSALAAPLRTFYWLRAAALLLAFVVTSAVSVTSYPGVWQLPGRAAGKAGGQRSPAVPGEQQFKGPLWSLAPKPVPPEFLGLTLNTDTGLMPGFRTGSVRLWNSETRWGTIERRRGDYDWTILDRMVESAERERLPVLFTFGGTPLWAASDGRNPIFKDSLASPPDDLDDWDRFVEKVVERYRGRIESYELWDYPSHEGMFSGTVSLLARMAERAARIIRRLDPDARVACPSFGHLRSERGRSLLREFARTDALESCDALALKMPPRKPDGPPEEIIELAADVHRLLHEEGYNDMHLWNTGPDMSIVLAEPLDARRARDYAVRFYLSGLFSRHYGMRRMYFYNWGGTGLPIVVQPVGGRPTEAGLRMGRLARWLKDTSIVSCGEGGRSGLAEGAYTCRFERDGRALRVYWTTRGRAEVTLGRGAQRLRHMDGSTTPAREGDRIGFGEEPVMIEYRAK